MRKTSRRVVLGGAAGAASGMMLGACASSAPKEASSAQGGGTAANAPAPAAGPVPLRTLGRTGERVSAIGLGGAHMGRQADEQESIRIVRHAIDHGITFLDNCWDYNEGKSEERMGKALAGGYRQKAFLMTKIDGRTKQSAAQQLEQSLQRLGTDMIDLVQVHEVIRLEDPDRVFAAGGTMEALIAARSAGKIRYIGFTGHKDPYIHLKMLRTADEHGFSFDTVQMPLNVMDPHFKSFERLVLPVLLQKKLGVLGMKPLGSGDILKSGVVSAPECLRYSLSLPTSVVITGCETVRDVDQAVTVARTFQPMTAEEVTALLDRTRLYATEGRYELFKTSMKYDGTAQHPQWLEQAKI